jgi:hypothetical protein
MTTGPRGQADETAGASPEPELSSVPMSRGNRSRRQGHPRAHCSLLHTIVHLAVIEDRRHLSTEYVAVVSRTGVNYRSWYVLNSHRRLISYRPSHRACFNSNPCVGFTRVIDRCRLFTSSSESLKIHNYKSIAPFWMILVALDSQ